MATMYDSVTPSAIPTSAAVVAGYVDGAYAWSNADWARFPQAVKARIAVFPRTNDGHVLDVEQGDATPAQAPGWVTMRRAAGIDPIVYCNTSTWPSVISAFRTAGVKEPPYWIAQYDGNPAIPSGAVAKQYNDPPGSGGNYDISNVSAAFIAAVTGGGPVTAPVLALVDQQAEAARLQALYDNKDVKDIGWGQTPATILTETNGVKAALDDIQAGITQLLAAVGAVDADVKTSAASVLAAIAAGVQVTLTADQVAQLETQIAKGLPGWNVNITPAAPPAAN